MSPIHTRQRNLVSEVRRAKILQVYDVALDFYPDWLEPREIWAAANKVAEEIGLPVSDVNRWLAEPERYSPFQDEVALDRAWHWDWPIVDNLTDWEWTLLIDRAARSDDPFGYKDSFVTKNTLRFYPSEEYTRDHTPRYSAWLSGTEQQRSRVERAVTRRRSQINKDKEN